MSQIHAPGFVFTAYVRWAGFRVHESLLPLAEMDNDEVGPAVEAAREVLRQHFRARRAEETKTVVEEWREEEVYPYTENPTDPVGQAEQALFNYVAVTASDAVNRIDDQQAKALSLRAIRVAVERDPSSIEFIFQEVLKLPAEKIEEFRELLERTSLPVLVDAMRLVTGRLEFLAGLEMLLFDPGHAPKVLERAHLHKMIESEPWLFGEEFAMHVSDRGLTALLQAHIALRQGAKAIPFLDVDTAVVAMLDELAALGVPMAVLSNCSGEEVEMLADSAIGSRIAHRLLSCDIGCAKPAREAYLAAAERLRLAPEDCLFVGDGSFNELLGTRAAGMSPIWATWFMSGWPPALAATHEAVIAEQRVERALTPSDVVARHAIGTRT